MPKKYGGKAKSCRWILSDGFPIFPWTCGIPVWSPIPEQQHRAVGRRAVLRSSSCLRPGRTAFGMVLEGINPREKRLETWFFHPRLSLSLHRLRFLTLASPGDLGNTSKLAEVWIFIHFRATKAICAGSNVSQPGLLPGFPHVSPPWAKHATRPPRPWRVEPVNCLNRSWLFKYWQLGSHKQYPWLTGA
jgi:hypothetical protein